MTGSEASGTSRLVLLRHGQTEWKARNWFTGWVNAPLTSEGERGQPRGTVPCRA